MSNNHSNNETLSARAELAILARRQERLMEALDAAQDVCTLLREAARLEAAGKPAQFSAFERASLITAVRNTLETAFDEAELVVEAAYRTGLLS